MLHMLQKTEILQFERVARWNDGPVPEELGGGTRGNDNCKPAFNLALNTEEIKEFYKAMAKEDIVEMVDAYADTLFVYYGILYKLGNLTISYTAVEIDAFKKAVDDTIFTINYVRNHLESMFVIMGAKYGITNKTILDKAFDIVCEANEQKGTAKDQHGKTMKGPKWVNPAETIKQLLIDEGIIK